MRIDNQRTFRYKKEPYSQIGCGLKLDHLKYIPQVIDTVKTVGKIVEPLLPEEKHMIMKTDTGWKKASYMGPGTDIISRIEKGDKPVSKADKVAMTHDIRYSLASDLDDIRKADNKMVNKLKDIQSKKQDYKINTTIPKLAIQGKMLAENLGVLDKRKFVDFNENKTLSDKQRKMLMNKLQELQSQGYGVPEKKEKKVLPRDLLMQTYKQMHGVRDIKQGTQKTKSVKQLPKDQEGGFLGALLASVAGSLAPTIYKEVKKLF